LKTPHISVLPGGESPSSLLQDITAVAMKTKQNSRTKLLFIHKDTNLAYKAPTFLTPSRRFHSCSDFFTMPENTHH